MGRLACAAVAARGIQTLHQATVTRRIQSIQQRHESACQLMARVPW